VTELVVDGMVPLCTATLDRAFARRKDPAWLDEAATNPESRLLLVGEGGLLPVNDRGELGWRSVGETAPAEGLIFLGIDETGRALFALETGDRFPANDFIPFRQVGGELELPEAAAALEAVGLTEWHRRHPFCARCGAPTEPTQGGHRRGCPRCGASHFPRMDPAVIMLVCDGDRCVLARRVNAPEGRWSTLAGYVEPGESLEAAVAREVEEEVALTVRIVRYRGSQPWPFPSSLMIAFEAEVEPDMPVVDGTEIGEARWFDRAELSEGIESGAIAIPGPIAASNFLIRSWLGQLPGTAGLGQEPSRTDR
jgi:NAD+ diphosphatase